MAMLDYHTVDENHRMCYYNMVGPHFMRIIYVLLKGGLYYGHKYLSFAVRWTLY